MNIQLQRPDASIVSEAIPLFYIGRNRNGLWVAREAEGRTGGIFLSRRAAARFAKESCEPAGCATMFVPHPLELEFANRSNSAAADDTARRGDVAESDEVGPPSPPLTLAAAVRKFLARIWSALASERRHRQALERDLFDGRYTVCSKSDDDFPVVL
jgi:hypothetical protein